jgi:NagD protein
MLQDKKIYFLDCDGTLALGDKPLPGAWEFLQTLKNKNKIFYILTNNSSKTPRQHLAKFNNLELGLKEENILVSSGAALEYFKQHNIKEIFWLANSEVSEFISSNNFIFTKINPQAGLLTYDNTLDYQKLNDFISLIRQGVPYYATHHDIVCPDPKGYLPDIGTFIKLIEMTTGLLPLKTFGKPSKDFIKPILNKHKLLFDDAVIVGDRLYTDMKLAEDSAMTSVLTLTGETKRKDYEQNKIKCDLVVNDLTELLSYL